MVQVLIQVVNFKKSLGTINLYESRTQKQCLTTDNVYRISNSTLNLKKQTKHFINSAIQFNKV